MRTWKEKIIAVMTGLNDRGKPLWYSHKKILDLISEAEGRDVSKTYRSLSNYLLELVKSGHLQRTIAPEGISNKLCHGTVAGKSYLYRRTSKPFVRGQVNLRSEKNKLTDAHLRGMEAHDLWREYPELPKWFRIMMMSR
jgi:hypothetical protein